MDLMKSGSDLAGTRVRVQFFPIKMKPFIKAATILRYNKNWKFKRYLVQLDKGAKYRIDYSQILNRLEKP